MVIEHVGCIPVYWRQFALTTQMIQKFSTCNSQKQYRHFKGFLPRIGNADRGTLLYTQPCEQMTIGINILQTQMWYPHYLELEFQYGSPYYMEITNVRGFSLNDLWSQTGGLVGIFLGCSLLQAPIILIACMRGTKKILGNLI